MLLPLIMTLGGWLMGFSELGEYIGPLLKGGYGQARMPLALGQMAVGALAAWGFAHFCFLGRDAVFMGTHRIDD